MDKIGKHEFKFVLTGVELTEDQQERISRTVAQAGTLALGDLLPEKAIGVQVERKIWWCGIPVDDLLTALRRHAADQVRIKK
ncbi:hypothetical protein ACWEQL_38560 [Kitasatospora sp. NPDC004240]